MIGSLAIKNKSPEHYFNQKRIECNWIALYTLSRYGKNKYRPKQYRTETNKITTERENMITKKMGNLDSSILRRSINTTWSRSSLKSSNISFLTLVTATPAEVKLSTPSSKVPDKMPVDSTLTQSGTSGGVGFSNSIVHDICFSVFNRASSV